MNLQIKNFSATLFTAVLIVSPITQTPPRMLPQTLPTSENKRDLAPARLSVPTQSIRSNRKSSGISNNYSQPPKFNGPRQWNSDGLFKKDEVLIGVNTKVPHCPESIEKLKPGITNNLTAIAIAETSPSATPPPESTPDFQLPAGESAGVHPPRPSTVGSGGSITGGSLTIQRLNSEGDGVGPKFPTIPCVYIVVIPGASKNQTAAIARKAQQLYQSDSQVIVELNTIRPPIAKTPNDIYFDKQWGLYNTGQIIGAAGRVGSDIDSPLAWDMSTGSPAIVVGVMDSGVDYNHPDLKDNIWLTPEGEPGKVFLSKNLLGSESPMDKYGHGTFVAGIISAVGNNDQGISGVSWRVKIAPLKIAEDYFGLSDTSAIIAAIDYAIRMKIPVVNMSFGSFDINRLEYAVFLAANDARMIIVAGAGNDSTNTDERTFYPAGYNLPNIISVAATDNQDALPYFSNYGLKTVDLAAPGVAILSTLPSDGCYEYGMCSLLDSLEDDALYGYGEGTSFAAPHVTGAVALALSVLPEGQQKRIRRIKRQLLETVDPIPDLADKTVSGGRLNLYNFIKAVITKAPQQSPIGFLDNVKQCTAKGWAVDPDTPTDSLEIHFYIDNPAGSGKLIGITQADLPSPDVERVTGYQGNHRFSWPIPEPYRSGKRRLYAHAIDTMNRGGPNPLLSHSPKKIRCR